jgi:hypothetical protein
MLAFNYNKYANNFNTIFVKTKKKTKPKKTIFSKNNQFKLFRIKYTKNINKNLFKKYRKS